MSTFTIKDYVVNRKRIGKGSFSTIYKAFNTKDNKQYAIKEVIIDKKSVKSNVKREFLVLKKLNHPNIVKLYDLIVDTNYNNIYFVFDYYSKGDFAMFLNNKPLKEKYCKKYAQQLGDGLQYLIENNIIHRDLKPQNILLTNELNIKITDFGFARKFDKNILLNTLCGSPMYMAPEIINKQDYSIKSDLWSVGIIIYQMFYGKVPYDVNNFIQLIKEINTKQINYNIKGIKISKNALNLLKGLLTIDVKDRITWNDYFYHNWFNSDELIDEDNNLLDFSLNSNSSIPSLSNFKHHINESQFASFKHHSIKDLEENTQLSYNTNIKYNENNDNENNDNDNENNDIEMNFLSSMEDCCSDYISCDEDSFKENLIDNNFENESEMDNHPNNLDLSYSNNLTNSSCNDDEINKLLNDPNKIHNHNYYTRSKKNNLSSIYDDNYNDNYYDNAKTLVNNQSNTFKSKTKPINIPNSKKGRVKYIESSVSGYIFIDPDISQQSEPIKHKSSNLTNSFKEYLYSSVNILRHSYNYLTSNKSI